MFLAGMIPQQAWGSFKEGPVMMGGVQEWGWVERITWVL